MADLQPFRARLLFIDDSRAQLKLYEHQMDQDYEVALAQTYEEAMANLTTFTPELIILDLVMPKVDGFEFLSILKTTKRFEKIPVIMVSSENDPQLVRKAFTMGASDFVRKPYDEGELKLRVQRLLQWSTGTSHVIEFEKQLSIKAKSFMIEALIDLSRTRDNETGYHLVRIKNYVTILATAASGVKELAPYLPQELLESVGELSVLHDIGKVGIPDSILKKPGPLTVSEFNVMKTHTTIGAQTIRQIQSRFPDQAFLEYAHQIALSHHERWDGKGYPEGLAGEQIPFPARLVTIADVFDALTTERVYKKAFSFDEALAIMESEGEKQFDPRLFQVFLECLPQFKEILERYNSERGEKLL